MINFHGRLSNFENVISSKCNFSTGLLLMDKSLLFSLFFGFVPGNVLGLCFTFMYLANNWKMHNLECSIGTPYHKIVLFTTDQPLLCTVCVLNLLS